MSLTQQINDEIKSAMKARNQERLTALRAIKSALLMAATEKGAGDEVDPAVEAKIIQKQYKQRVDSAETYAAQDRQDMADAELAEAAVIKEFMPEQMGEEELRGILAKIIADVGAAGPQDMGKVMGASTKQLAGKADGKMISSIVRELLAS